MTTQESKANTVHVDFILSFAACEESVIGPMTKDRKQWRRGKKSKEAGGGEWTPGWVLRLCGEEGRTQGGGRLGSFFQLFPRMGVYVLLCVCVCVRSICALVLEELNRGSYQMDTHTQMTASTHLHHVTTIQQFSPDCMLRCIQYSHFKAATYEQKTPWPRKSHNFSVQFCKLKVLQAALWSLFIQIGTDFSSYQVIRRHFVVFFA